MSGYSKAVVYYTDNLLKSDIAIPCQKQLERAVNGHYIVSVSLRPLDFGDNITLGLQRGYLTMYQQILAGVSLAEEDVVFLAEHDVIYHPDHFTFTPPRSDVFYYNQNVWRVSAKTGHALFHYHKSLSELCAHRRLLIDHLRERIAIMEAHKGEKNFYFRLGFEPGTKKKSHGGVDDTRCETWWSEHPNIDIRDTDSNATRTLWRREDFRNIKHTAGWTESSSVPYWGQTEGRMDAFLKDVAEGRLPV